MPCSFLPPLQELVEERHLHFSKEPAAAQRSTAAAEDPDVDGGKASIQALHCRLNLNCLLHATAGALLQSCEIIPKVFSLKKVSFWT